MVRVRAIRSFAVPVTLSQIKKNKVLFEFQMIKQAGLLCSSSSKKIEWNEICKMANLKKL